MATVRVISQGPSSRLCKQMTSQGRQVSGSLARSKMQSRTSKCDSYKLSAPGRQKASYQKVGFRGKRNGTETRYGLYFKRVDDEWRIVEELWIPDSTN